MKGFWDGSNLISQTAKRSLNWVISSRMPSHSLMGYLKVLSCVRCFLLFTLPPSATIISKISDAFVNSCVETAALLANSMISSRIDYCNSPLYGLNKYNVAKCQKIQNALCRFVFRLDKTSHVTSYLQKLYWLPISYRIIFKYNLITFQGYQILPTHIIILNQNQ